VYSGELKNLASFASLCQVWPLACRSHSRARGVRIYIGLQNGMVGSRDLCTFFPGFQTVVASIFLSVATGQPGLWPVAFAFSGVQCKCKALAKISCRVPTREAAGCYGHVRILDFFLHVAIDCEATPKRQIPHQQTIYIPMPNLFS
jgi:hypothetical protein